MNDDALYPFGVVQPMARGSDDVNLIGGAGPSRTIWEDSFYNFKKSLFGGARHSTAGAVITGVLEKVDRSQFKPDPAFDPYDAAIRAGSTQAIGYLKEAQSAEEFDWMVGKLQDDAERNKQIALSPFGRLMGALGPDLLLPSNFYGLAARQGIAAAAKGMVKSVGVGMAEDATAVIVSPEYTIDHMITNAIVQTGIRSALLSVVGIGKVPSNGLKNGPELAARRAMDAENELNRALGGVVVQNVDDIVGANGNVLEGAKLSMGAAQLRQPATEIDRILQNQAAEMLGGVENIPPFMTILSQLVHNRTVAEVGETAQRMYEVPYATRLNAAGETMGPSVENKLRTTWRPVHGEWRSALDEGYKEFLEEFGVPVRAGTILVSDIEQRLKNTGNDFVAFRKQVWRDRARGMTDDPAMPTPRSVRKAAIKTQEMYDKLINDAVDLGLHVVELERKLKKTTDPIKIDALKKQIKDRTDNIRKNQSKYVNVIFNKGKILQDRAAFEAFVSRKTGLNDVDAREKVDEMLRESSPFMKMDVEGVGSPRALHERTLVDDPLEWEEWLDTDVLNGGTLYIRSMSADIELAREFGTPDMRDHIKDIKDSYQQKIDASPSQAKKEFLEKEREKVVENLIAGRDVLRGTYMLPPDPEHGISTAIRVIKNWNIATMLTGALAAVPDMARVAFANGLSKSMGSLFEQISDPALYKMGKKEARSVGEAWDLVLGTRAAIFADIGEAVGGSSKIERISAEVGQQSFNINLMNWWNETMKSATSLVLSTRILEDVEKIAAGTASQKQIMRAAAHFIDKEMAQRILRQQDHWQRTRANIVSNTAEWTDRGAQDAFRAALSRELNIVIITPGLAERPKWMMQTMNQTLGREPGEGPAYLDHQYLSLVGQFKTMMIATHYRTIVPGLQFKDMNTVGMLVGSVAMGVIVNQLGAVADGRQPKTGLMSNLMDGIDRAGIAGVMLEPNNILERATGGIGLHSLMGGSTYDPAMRSRLGAFFGPVGSVAGSALDVGSDIVSGQISAGTLNTIAKIVVPYNNVKQLVPVFDAVGEAVTGTIFGETR